MISKKDPKELQNKAKDPSLSSIREHLINNHLKMLLEPSRINIPPP